MTRQVKAKPQTIEQSSTAQDVRESEGPHEVGQRIGWIRQHEDDCVRGGRRKPRQNLLVDAGVRLESRSLPFGSARSVAPPAFSLVPAAIITRVAPSKSG